MADVTLPRGTWYLTIEGDPAGRTSGFMVDADVFKKLGLTAAYNATNDTDDGNVHMTSNATQWGTCAVPRLAVTSSAPVVQQQQQR